ncbi:MAG TPA: Stp1/IreP family PP2C-type Ser/Thr phosphatase [Candidatus Binataceae bacterium]|nr:Stp1/IreP family PP2C-type Ser/Thr phosphatase [Candidatus Binataceae bacterium]
MITCPECGQTAPDDGKFCDRCGQCLAKAAAAPPPNRPAPLAPGTMLIGGIEILEVSGQTSIENCYRAKRAAGNGIEMLTIRERFAPPSATEEAKPSPPDAASPSAKTTELKAPVVQTNGAASAKPTERNASATGGSGGAIQTATESAAASQPVVLTEVATADGAAAAEAIATEAPPEAELETEPPPDPFGGADLGEVFGRVLALSLTIDHPAFMRATSGFSEGGRVYLVYPHENLTPIGRGTGKIGEPEAIALGIQLCQAIGFAHRRALRLNDLCPESIGVTKAGRLKLSSLDYVSNDNELQSEPIFNDGYTAPEIYRGKQADKRADIFSAGALLYTWLTGERIPSESWREEAGPVDFYPPHVISPKLENAIRRALTFNPAGRWSNIADFKAELTQLAGVVRIQAAVLTDVGLMREHNEDAVMAAEYTRESLLEPAQSHLFVVADGMGGAEAGEVASAIALKAIREHIENRLGSVPPSDPSGLLAAALEDANQQIIEYQAAHPESRGMGSTAVSALVLPPDAAVAWVGDSRAYLMDGTSLRQITRDHSLVQRLIEIGQLTPEEARTHEHKNVITRSLGARQSGPAGAEALAIKLKRGDRMLLCSDGLTAHLDDAQICEILSRHGDPYSAARELIVAANAGGGSDNISVAVIFAS